HPQLVQNLAWLFILEAVILAALILREQPQRAARERGVVCQRLERRDAAIATKQRDVPWNACGEVEIVQVGGRKHLKVGQRSVERASEERVARLDLRSLRQLLREGAVLLGPRLVGMLARRFIVAARASVFQRVRDFERDGAVWLDLDVIGRRLAIKLIGWRREGEPGRALMPVCAVVLQLDLITMRHGINQLTALAWLRASDDEHVGEVAPVAERDIERGIFLVKIADLERLRQRLV